ncbi:MAG: hypothetical protein DRH21_08250 [Deltaproteobacteria bacterium]|nr:MAG: hypothetical protein DRH21_08250 [Deltaproteobacteria bacterium]
MKSKIILLILVGLSMVLLAQDKNLTLDDEVIGTTYYDLQTWRTMQNRTFYNDDGTIGSVWNMGMDYPDFPDMGIGYNYYDVGEWGEYPAQSITSGWAINPSYTAYQEDGEICVSQGEDGLFVNIRETKGNGPWQESYLEGAGFKHPVVITNGVDHSIIQLLYLKADESFTPTPAQPIRGFIWYARSSDGGQTWDINQQISELGPDNYLGFTIGSYCWAEPKQDVIAFVAGDYLTDLVLMKSEDGGNTWQKTVIWEHPYPMFELFTVDSDTFFCNDGGISVALDNQNRANVTFTVSRVYSSTAQDSIWYDPKIDGVVYWNEDRPTFTNDINALCPFANCSYTELVEDYSLVGWLQDLNGNDTIDLLEVRPYPTPGLCTMPQILIDDQDHIFVAYSSITEGYENDTANFRHIWVRLSLNGEWWGNFTDLTASLEFVFSECVYISMAPYIDDYFYFTFQEDNQPGLTDPTAAVYSENNIRFMSHNIGWPYYWVEAGFIADSTIIHEGDTVSFINQSVGNGWIQYYWTFEGGIPLNSYESNPDIIYFNEGIFDVQLLANISDTPITDVEVKEDYITVLPAININENNKKENLEIFPNPGNGIFTINLNLENPKDITLNVYNILGKFILESTSGKIDDQLKLDLTDQENGIYFIQIKNGSTLITKKIAVQH